MGRLNYKGQSNASPFRRIITARGLNMMECAVHSGVSLTALRKFDRMDVEVMGGIKVLTLLKVSKFLGVSPTDLLPFLAATVEKD